MVNPMKRVWNWITTPVPEIPFTTTRVVKWSRSEDKKELLYTIGTTTTHWCIKSGKYLGYSVNGYFTGAKYINGIPVNEEGNAIPSLW